jgi:hypothetical protein
LHARTTRDPDSLAALPEAPLRDSGSGLAPAAERGFAVNVRDAQWLTAANAERMPPRLLLSTHISAILN